MSLGAKLGCLYELVLTLGERALDTKDLRTTNHFTDRRFDNRRILQGGHVTHVYLKSGDLTQFP
jgi:hypothetical protein